MISTSITVKQSIFYLSYALFPILLVQLWWLRRSRRMLRVSIYVSIAITCFFIWMRFIEPQMIQVRTTHISQTGLNTRIALISDLHIGLYKSPEFLERVVKRINELEVDSVLIAGDLTYYPEGVLSEIFASLRSIKVPTYAVLGNHDQQRPGPDIDQELRAALTSLNVQIIEHQQVKQGDVVYAGLGDRWASNDQPDSINLTDGQQPMIVLMHNPDSALALKASHVRLALAGHTHCGQIAIPMLSDYYTPGRPGLRCGLVTAPGIDGDFKMFVGAGLGEVGLPLRLFNPPTIEYLILEP